MSYSDIIKAEDYVRIMAEHIYMKTADRLVADTATRLATPDALVLDLGCGPGRITRLIKGVKRLIGVDIDKEFLDYASFNVPKAQFVQANLLEFRHDEQADVVVSHGLHHHIDSKYLAVVSQYVKTGGYYVLGDEFLMHYLDNTQRVRRAIQWYMHVIGTALKDSFFQLAEEEAKTLLDDILHGSSQHKNLSQVQSVLEKAGSFCLLYERQDWRGVEVLIDELLGSLFAQESTTIQDIPLSRGDYKIDHGHLVIQLKSTPFEIVGVQTVGPMNTIGGFAVYVLRKK